MPSTATIPEQGQLVEVRRRRFVVTEVKRSNLPTENLKITPQHLVTLSSIEDDGLGEELSILWEIEPGAKTLEKSNLPPPVGFDKPERLDAFLHAVSWGTSSLADIRTLQAPFRSGIVIEDYQLDPVVRALQMPRVNLLIADDVGLGKTIEAGLVVQEMILRHRTRSVLIICPASLQVQWREQMRDKFGLEFRIVDSEMLRELRRRRGLHVNPWTHFPRLITSIDFLKRERPLRLFREMLPGANEPQYPRRFDLMIIDEAHNVAPSGSGAYAIDSQRTAAIRLLEPHFENKLFLTATPHNGYPESFSALLELLDNQRFACGVKPDKEQLAAVMVRRLKRELPPGWDGKPRFPERKLLALDVDYPKEEKDAHQALQEYTKLRRANAKDNAELFAAEFVLKLLKKRLFSSPAAFSSTITQHEKSQLQENSRKSVEKPSISILRQYEANDEETADDAQLEETLKEVIEVSARSLPTLSPKEKSLLQQLRKWAESAVGRADAKAERMLRWLHDVVKPKGKWSDERVIIFTEYRDTQKWLQGLLASEKLAENGRLMLLFGGMPSEDREKVKAAFQAHPSQSEVRILLATDAASEGIDLQNHCHRLVHYEIPWNPNRMEQRNGRVDRHGQKKDVLVHHFVGKNFDDRLGAERDPGDLDGDLEFLFRAARKVENIREDLGTVGPVIAEQVTEAMLGKRRNLDTSRVDKKNDQVKKLLKIERQLREQLQKFVDQLKETQDALQLTPENIEAVVHIGLALAGQQPLRPATVSGLWPDPKRSQCPVYHLPALTGSWSQCSEGLKHPHTEEIRPIVFDESLARGRDNVVLAHLGHRLVQMCLRLLRAEVWAGSDRKGLHRFTARMVRSQSLKTPAVLIHGRLVILGGDDRRLHEELICAGGVLEKGNFQRIGVKEVEALLEHQLPTEPSEDIKKKLLALWPEHSKQLLSSLEARMKDKTESLQKKLQERADKECSDMKALLEELRKHILDELKDPELTAQMELDFSSTEKEQLERNRKGLEERVNQIPHEIRQETKLIQARYRDPKPRLFPVAVTYLIPEGMK